MDDDNWYSKDVDYVLKSLDTSRDGLTSEEAKYRLEKYGPNELVETGGIHPIRMFLEQFADPMVTILLVAIAISLFTSLYPGLGSEHEGSGLVDAIVISAIVIFDAVFGFVQEYKSADVGISMGIHGADVTKEASDVILTDDSFASSSLDSSSHHLWSLERGDLQKLGWQSLL